MKNDDKSLVDIFEEWMPNLEVDHYDFRGDDLFITLVDGRMYQMSRDENSNPILTIKKHNKVQSK